MPPIKFKLNQTYSLRADVDFQSDLLFESRCDLKIFKIAAMVTIFDIRMEPFSQFSISMLPRCLPPSFCSIRLRVQDKLTIEDFQDDRHEGHYGYDSDEDVENVKSY